MDLKNNEIEVLKVPPWLAKKWLQAPDSAVLGEIDLATGHLQLNGAAADEPVTFDVVVRESKDL
jgi:hypothetical protein